MSLHAHLPTPPLLAEIRRHRAPVRDVNKEHAEALSGMDRLAVFITERVGTMGFFFLIFLWTVVWCGYNVLASEVPRLGWPAFDPFPAFVAYLLMSNVVQILLMPLIMVGQNVQGRHAELRAQSDFEVNIKAEQEIEVILRPRRVIIERPSATPGARSTAAGMLAHLPPEVDEELDQIIRGRKTGTFREIPE